MSTDLYGVRVLEVAPHERRLRLRVFVVYYDTHHEYHQPIPTDRSFFVRVLCDKDALGDDIAAEQRFDEDYIDRNAFRYVERFVELERRNAPVESYGGFADFYYERDGGWQNEDKLVQADYDVFVTKDDYLAAFAAGESWGTTAYQTSADRLTEDEYLDLPDFGDVQSFAPFPDAVGDMATVVAIAFSSDGQLLLVENKEGERRVFSTEDWSMVEEAPDADDPRFADRPSLEGIDKAAAELEAFGYGGINSAVRSPDGRFVLACSYHELMLLNSTSGAPLRSMRPRGGYAVAVTWSPNGRLTATSIADAQGAGGKVIVHRVGRDVLAAEKAPHELPARTDCDITDLAKLYVAQTNDFASGWSTHLDDDFFDFHLAIAQVGKTHDLVAHINAAPAKIGARAYEAIIAHRNGDAQRAEAALQEAVELVERTDVDEWSHTYVYAPLAAAQHLLGRAKLAEASLELARVELDKEANPFQKRAVFARALLIMGRLDEVGEVIRNEQTAWHSRYHRSLLCDLADAGEFELLEAGFKAWRAASDWETPPQVQQRLLARGDFERAISLDWLDCNRADRNTAVEAWLAWFEADPDAAQAHLDKRLEQESSDTLALEVICHRDPEAAKDHARLLHDRYAKPGWLAAALQSSHDNLARSAWLHADVACRLEVARKLCALGRLDLLEERDVDDLAPEDHIEWLGILGRWEDAYAQINAMKRTRRPPMYQRIADAACLRGDVDILVDALAQVPCFDMNSAGLRALQKAFKDLAGPNYRELHP